MVTKKINIELLRAQKLTQPVIKRNIYNRDTISSLALAHLTKQFTFVREMGNFFSSVFSQQKFETTDVKSLGTSQLSDSPCDSSRLSDGPCYTSWFSDRQCYISQTDKCYSYVLQLSFI